MMNSITCKTTANGQQSFYLKANGKEYFLFSQAYRTSVNQHYNADLTVDRALDFSVGMGKAVRKTKEKLRVYISYVEKEYSVCVLNKTKKAQHPKKTGRRRCDYDGYEAA